MVPLIRGALWTVSKDTEKWLAEIDVACRLESSQRAFTGEAKAFAKS